MCGDALTGRQTMFCSRACKTKAARARPENAEKKKLYYLQWTYGLSESEARQALAEGRRMEKSSGVVQCVVCGKDIIAKRKKTRKYCSYQCSNAAVKAGVRPPPPKKPRGTIHPMPCEHCGEMFIPVRYTEGRNKYCGPGCKSAARSRRPEEREKSLVLYYRRKYGLTREQVEEMKAGGCAICGRFQAEGRWDNGNLHIDHCHETGRVRGVLCHSCNVGIGYFKDDRELLARAIEYLG